MIAFSSLLNEILLTDAFLNPYFLTQLYLVAIVAAYPILAAALIKFYLFKINEK